MKKEYLVSIPATIITSNVGIDFYDKVKIVECRANGLKEIFFQYPNALKVELKEK